MGFPLEGNQSLRVTGRLRARFFFTFRYTNYTIYLHMSKKSSNFAVQN